MSPMRTLEGSEAVALVAYAASEVIAIYPITPSSNMGEWADQWMSESRPNLWGTVPSVVEMQSEGGVAGAVHGALQAGSLSTTFTASQGLLLMLPNMFKIAGELTPFVLHVAARTVATHALSIFGDHSDVMAARATGFAMLASNSVQESHDLAMVAHAATLRARLPFMHFFDGFRTSHETNKIELLDAQTMRSLLDHDAIAAHRGRALSPDRPVLRGSAQNPDVWFQGREACNPWYAAAPGIVQEEMDKFAKATGRRYRLFDYVGAPDADRVVVVMGSGAETMEQTSAWLNAHGEKTGVLKVRLFRPFAIDRFLAALPKTVKTLGVLDRTKEPGASGEPLYNDVITALVEGIAAGTSPLTSMPRVIGGRFGLSSKEFSPGMAKAVFDELKKAKPRNHFTVGINDDVSHTSLEFDPAFDIEDDETVRAVFFGLGSDGTVGANKNTIKIIGEETERHAQGYFIYDSKKSGSTTTSHLRFGPNPIRAPYLITQASFVACHQFAMLDRLSVLDLAAEGATFLLNAPYPADVVWGELPLKVRETIVAKKLKLYVIDALSVARDAGMGRRINTVMQTCFFALSRVLPRDKAIEAIKYSIKKTYGKRGESVVERNVAAVDQTLENLFEVAVPARVGAAKGEAFALRLDGESDFIRNVTAPMILGKGEALPVSAMPADGTFPTGTACLERRNIAAEIPVWDPSVCIQCGKCVLVCPHAVIRAKLYDPANLNGAPATFQHAPSKWPDRKDVVYTLQVAPEDCTGCALCVEVCPAKNKSNASRKAINMEPQAPLAEAESANWDFFRGLPDGDRRGLDTTRVKDIQLCEPLFEFSGACAGCGETPYLKMVSQLFGDRAIIANATGCTSIYGGNLPTTPWSKNKDGRGPAWANSLFEDNAEFGLGIRLALDKQEEFARELVKRLEDELGTQLVDELLSSPQASDEDIARQRGRVATLKHKLATLHSPEAALLLGVADVLVRRSLWIVGGDGWAYDIDFGGLDHVLAVGRNVNILVLDTEVYSNTGGQQSKSTPRGAVAKFAAGGKRSAKKDMATLAMSYGSVYVARVAFGGNDAHTLKVMKEAESYPGTSLILAYSHCIAHGYDLVHGVSQQKAAVESGYWPLLRYDPRRREQGLNPMQLDSKAPSLPLQKYLYNETRYSMLAHSQPEVAKQLLDEAAEDVRARWKAYEHLASGGAATPPKADGAATPAPAANAPTGAAR